MSDFDKWLDEHGKEIVQKLKDEAVAAASAEIAKEVPERTHEIAQSIELRDELQIAEELQGKVLAEFFYSFPLHGATVTGLSYAGVRAIARTMASGGESLSVIDLKVNDDGDHYTALAKVENLRTHEVRWGVASQVKIAKTRKGDLPDEFALVKSVNKAQRNGLRAHIPEAVITAMWAELQKAKQERKG